VIFEKEVAKPFLSAKPFWKPRNSLSFVMIQIAAG